MKMDAEKYDEVDQLIEELKQGGLPDESALVKWLRNEVTRLENCPLCGGPKEAA
jgi:hypothetical protein